MASALGISSATTDLQDIRNEDKNCRVSPINLQQIQSLSTTMAEPKKKQRKRKKNGKMKTEDTARKTIQWSGLRMIVESAFGPSYAWLSEMLEMPFMYSQRKSGISIDSLSTDMVSFFVKYKDHSADIRYFLNLAELTSRSWGQALLLLAIEIGNIEAVRKLFTEEQANITFVDASGRPAILYASCINNPDILQELLQRGADIHFLDYQGRNAIWYACKNDNYSVVEVLANNEASLPEDSEDEESGMNLFDSLKPSQSAGISNFESFLIPHRPKADNMDLEPRNPDGPSQPLSDNETGYIGCCQKKEKGGEREPTCVHYQQKDVKFESHRLNEVWPELGTESVDDNTESDESSNVADGTPDSTILSDIYEDTDYCSDEEVDSEDSDASDILSLGGVDVLHSSKQADSYSESKSQTIPKLMQFWMENSVDQALRNVSDWRERIPGMTLCPGSDQADHSSSNSRTASSSISSTNQGGSGDGSVSQRKTNRRGNKKGDDKDDNPEDDDRKRENESAHASPNNVSSMRPRRFACPFWRKYREKYGSDKRKACQKPGFETTHRLKEHLYRCHKYPIHCDRCMEEFETEEERKQHCKQTKACVPSTSTSYDPSRGFTKEQEEQLRSRKRGRTERQKWERIYHILFPGEEEPLPDPYVDVEPEIDSLQQFVEEQMERLPVILRKNILKKLELLYPQIRVFVEENLDEVLQESQQEVLEDFQRKRSRNIPIADQKVEGTPILEFPGKFSLPVTTVLVKNEETSLTVETQNQVIPPVLVVSRPSGPERAVNTLVTGHVSVHEPRQTLHEQAPWEQYTFTNSNREIQPEESTFCFPSPFPMYQSIPTGYQTAVWSQHSAPDQAIHPNIQDIVSLPTPAYIQPNQTMNMYDEMSPQEPWNQQPALAGGGSFHPKAHNQ